MRPLVRWSVAVLSAGILAAGGVVAMSVAGNGRAEEICRDEAPQSAGGHSVTWEWSEFAYVCDYRGRERPRSVGVIDAFHGEGSGRHR